MKKIIVLILSLFIIGCGDSSSSSSSKSSKLSQEQINFIEQMVKDGDLSVTADMNKAEISPSLWRNMKASLKEDFSSALAIYVGNKKGTKLYWVEIFDSYSGKKLAKYSKSYGFTIY